MLGKMVEMVEDSLLTCDFRDGAQPLRAHPPSLPSVCFGELGKTALEAGSALLGRFQRAVSAHNPFLSPGYSQSRPSLLCCKLNYQPLHRHSRGAAQSHASSCSFPSRLPHQQLTEHTPAQLPGLRGGTTKLHLDSRPHVEILE